MTSRFAVGRPPKCALRFAGSSFPTFPVVGVPPARTSARERAPFVLSGSRVPSFRPAGWSQETPMTSRPSFMPFALRLATLCVLTVSGFLPRDARADVVRTFTFSPHDVAVVQGPAGVVVAMEGGVPDGAPGGPELPAVPAFIE